MAGKILVIDQNVVQSALVRTSLGSARYTVVTAMSLDEGLAAAKKHRFDLLMWATDTEPGTFPEWWKTARETLGHLPVILIGKGNGFPAAATLLPPINTTELVERVRQLVPIPSREEEAMATMPEALTTPAEETRAIEQELGWREEAAGGAVSGAQDPLTMGVFPEGEIGAAQTPGITASGKDDEDTPDKVTPGGMGNAGDDVIESLQNLLENDFPELAEHGKESGPVAPPTPATADDSQYSEMVKDRVEEIVSNIARETVERVVWETVPAMVLKVMSDKREEQEQVFREIVEKVVWEILPDLAAQTIKEEVARLSGEEEK